MMALYDAGGTFSCSGFRTIVLAISIHTMRCTKSLQNNFSTPPTSDPPDAVLGLRVLPRGRLYRLDNYIQFGRPKLLIAIGADTCVDLRIERDDTVSGTHCGLWLKHGRVWVEDANSKNGTRVNGSLIKERSRLSPGQVLTLGRTSLLVFGRAGKNQRPLILASSLDAYIRTAVNLYGSVASAGRALGVPTSTLARWLRETRFAA